MVAERRGKRFVIDGFARTGSTALARVLSLCADTPCLIEPFHPARYNGQYHNEVTDAASLQRVLDLLWLRWIGIKHVWIAPEGFPFSGRRFLNDEIVLRADAVIWIRRRNHLQRYVSAVISKNLRFWIGSKEDYYARLERVGFPELSPEIAKKCFDDERLALEQRETLLLSKGVKFHTVFYEDLFGPRISAESQLDQINAILSVIGCTLLPGHVLGSTAWNETMNREVCKWNTRAVYERIPGIADFERQVGSDDNGWL